MDNCINKKITLVIGEHIEQLDPETLEGASRRNWFPELVAVPQGRDVAYLPRHARHTAALVRSLYLQALKPDESPIVIITHSQDAVNLAGLMISEGALAATDVQVCMYDGERPEGPEPSATYTFDEEGILRGNWPFGWFDAHL